MKHKGIVLAAGHIQGFENRPVRYRVRRGRGLALCTVAGLTREWLDVYVNWFRARGLPEKAMALKAEWLESEK